MGLLDQFDPNGLVGGAGSFLASGGPSLTPVSTSQAFGRGLLGYQQGAMQGQDQKLKQLIFMAQLQKQQQDQADAQQRMQLQREQLAQQGLLQNAQISNYGRLADADARKAATEEDQRVALGKLAGLLTPQGSFGKGTDMERDNAQVRPGMTEDEAIQLGRQLRDQGNPPTTINVPNPGMVQSLALQADPQRAIGKILDTLHPNQNRFSPRGEVIQDANSPTGWSYRNPLTNAITPGAPVPGSVIGAGNLGARTRDQDYRLPPAAAPAAPTAAPATPGAYPAPASVPGAVPTASVVDPGLPPKARDDIKVDAAKKTTAQIVKGLEENYTRLRDAPQQLENIEKAKSLIPSARSFQGPLGEQKLWAAKFFNSNTPITIDLTGVGSAEELRTRIFMNVMDNLKKMDAQPSQLQQQIMQDSLGKLGTDPDALPKVLDAYGDAIRDKVGLFQQQVDEAKSNGINWPHKINVKPRQTMTPTGGYSDAEKERRYQEFKAKQAR